MVWNDFPPIVATAPNAEPTFCIVPNAFWTMGTALSKMVLQFLPIADQSTLLIPFCTFSTKPLNPLFSYRFLNAPERFLLVSLTTFFATAPPDEPPDELFDEDVSDFEELSVLESTFSLSKPATLLFAFSELFWTLSSDFELSSAVSVRLLAESDADLILLAVLLPVSQPKTFESDSTAPLAYSVKVASAELNRFTTWVATWRIGWPTTARSCFQLSLRLPVTFSQPSASRLACPIAPESWLASLTICKSVSCFCDSDKSINDLPYSLLAAAFRVVSVQDKPSAASFSKLPLRNDFRLSAVSSSERS